MNLEDIKDSLTTRSAQIWDRVQESSFFNQLKDRYEGLSSLSQKLVLGAIGALIAVILLMTPWSNWSSSSDAIGQFENRRDLIHNLLKVSRESSNLPNLPVPPPVSALRGDVENKLNEANLLTEQIRGIEVTSPEGSLIPKKLSSGGVNVSLSKLNLRQIVDIGYRLQTIHPSVKMKDMFVTANREDARYFDAIFKLVALNVPDMSTPPPPIEEEPKKGANKNKKKSKTGEE